MIVSLKDVKDRLRIDFDDQDDMILQSIAFAEEKVRDIVKDELYFSEERVKRYCYLLILREYNYPDGSIPETIEKAIISARNELEYKYGEQI